MSRIGRAPIEIPAGVEVTCNGNVVTVKGPKGTLSHNVHPDMTVTVEGNTIHVTRPSDDKLHRSLHGLTRTLIHNMVIGVTEGFSKTLEINGVAPCAETVVAQTYPIARELFMFTNGTPAQDSLTAKFIGLSVSQKGREIIEEIGFVPVPEKK